MTPRNRRAGGGPPPPPPPMTPRKGRGGGGPLPPRPLDFLVTLGSVSARTRPPPGLGQQGGNRGGHRRHAAAVDRAACKSPSSGPDPYTAEGHSQVDGHDD